MSKDLFPMQPRKITESEGLAYFENMVAQIREFNPDEIVAVARSGFSYAMWVAQRLRLPLGVYYHKPSRLITQSANPRRLVFVDDNILQGSTYKTAVNYMANRSEEWRWAVLFSDWFTPPEVRAAIIQCTRLPFFAEEPMWGSHKVSVDYNVRFRDEGVF